MEKGNDGPDILYLEGIMKKTSFLIATVMAVLMTFLSTVTFAASADENPYKNLYVKEAQAIRQQGTAKIIYQFMTRGKAPLPGVTMIYNTTKEHGVLAVADEKGMIEFDLKASDVYFIRQVIYKGKVYQVSGSSVANTVEKLDIRKGTVFWNCVVQYGNAAFMSYRGN